MEKCNHQEVCRHKETYYEKNEDCELTDICVYGPEHSKQGLSKRIPLIKVESTPGQEPGKTKKK